MNAILAVILVCAATTAQPDCTRDTALDVITAPTPSLFACMMTGQASVARDQLLGDGRYTKVVCGGRRAVRPAPHRRRIRRPEPPALPPARSPRPRPPPRPATPLRPPPDPGALTP